MHVRYVLVVVYCVVLYGEEEEEEVRQAGQPLQH